MTIKNDIKIRAKRQMKFILRLVDSDNPPNAPSKDYCNVAINIRNSYRLGVNRK